jgi:acetate kinase
MTVERFHRMVNAESGLLGLSETSSDMRDLLMQEESDPRAAEAITLFCYQARKWIGALAAVLGGLDTLVFSAGIGENAPVIRARICAGLEFLGVVLDESANAANEPLISSGESRVRIRVIRTDEEREIAESVARLLRRQTGISKESSS